MKFIRVFLVVVAFFGLLTFSFSAHSVELETFIETLQNYVVRVQANSYSGYGVVISKKDGHIISAYHIIVGEDENKDPDSLEIKVLVGNQIYKAKILKYDVLKDLVLLKIEKVFDEIPDFSFDYQVGDKVFVLGKETLFFSREITEIIKEKVKGRISLFLILNTPLQKGLSGSGVFDENGNLVGLAQYIKRYKDTGEEFGQAIASEEIQGFLEEIIPPEVPPFRD